MKLYGTDYLYRQTGMILITSKTYPDQYVPNEEETLEDEEFLADGEDDPTLPSHYIDIEPPPAIDIAATEKLKEHQIIETEDSQTAEVRVKTSLSFYTSFKTNFQKSLLIILR